MSVPVTVSVIITTYNQSALIEETIGSVLAQTRLPDEVIVVDDGSTDDTAGRVKALGGGVRYVHQQNQGVPGSRNTGMSLATGDLLVLLDGDDVWHPQKIELQVEAFRTYPDSGIVAVGFTPFTDAVPASFHLDAASIRVDSRDRFADLVRSSFLGTTSQVAIPRRVIDSVGTSDTAYRICSDYDLYLRIARRFPVTVVEAPLCYWRYRPSSVSGPSDLRRLTWAPEMIRILKNCAAELEPHRRQQADQKAAELLTEVARTAYDRGVDGDRRFALRYLAHLIRWNPSFVTSWLYVVGLVSPRPLRRLGARLMGTSAGDRQTR